MSTMGSGSEPMLRSDLDALRADISALKDDLRVLAADAASAGSHGVKAVRGRLGDVAGSLNEKGHAAYDAARQKAAAAAETAEQKIHDHPFTSVAVAFGVGVLLGAIIGRR
jgi:ElaB/YqjD/DUF883 family membrane-anchored ribosome-binding protein